MPIKGKPPRRGEGSQGNSRIIKRIRRGRVSVEAMKKLRVKRAERLDQRGEG